MLCIGKSGKSGKSASNKDKNSGFKIMEKDSKKKESIDEIERILI